MKLEIVNTSVVVLAQQYNPTVLHPAFLTSEEIVPADWQVAEAPLCTILGSVVKYVNGLVFITESNKFQLIDNKPPDDLGASQVPPLAAKYIRRLPHTHYTAVGVNMLGFVACSNPEAILIERFLKAGVWNEDPLKPQALGLRFVYQVPQAVLHLSCNAGTFGRDQESDQKAGILLDANYHTDISAAASLEEAEKAIALFSQRYAHFTEVTKIIFELEN
ncbi:MAG: hypothetical protein HY314_06260 [Acidobacteria bacterium]|nr:hypothetical protein [Acidobacteriota bacterium]